MAAFPRVAYLEHHSHKLEVEEELAHQALRERGIPVRLCAASELQRNRVILDPEGLAVGRIPFVKAALQQRGVALPLDNCYPEVLRDLLHRKIWRTTLLSARMAWERGEAVFVKPAGRTKRFTGCVLSHAAVYNLLPVSRSTEVWCSEVVQWRSEWRAYVVHGAVRHLAHYDGDPAAGLDIGVITQAVAALETAGAPAGYAIDFGVLSTGETALVECNDGFSIGAYGALPADVYLDMLIARWLQLTAQ